MAPMRRLTSKMAPSEIVQLKTQGALDLKVTAEDLEKALKSTSVRHPFYSVMHRCEWVMAHMWMSHGTRVNESCHNDKWVMLQVWKNHVFPMCVTSFICYSFIWLICYSFIWLMMLLIHMTHDVTHSYDWINHVIHMLLIQMSHDSFTRVTWLIHTCDMTRQVPVSAVTWLIHAWHHSFTRVTWLIHTCDMTHPHVCHDSPPCISWLMTHSHVWHDSWLIHKCIMTHSHDSWLIHMCDMTHQASVAAATLTDYENWNAEFASVWFSWSNEAIFSAGIYGI